MRGKNVRSCAFTTPALKEVGHSADCDESAIHVSHFLEDLSIPCAQSLDDGTGLKRAAETPTGSAKGEIQEIRAACRFARS